MTDQPPAEYLDINKAHFDRLYEGAAIYRPAELWNRRQRALSVLRCLRRSDSRLIEIGCGEGVVTRILARHCPAHVAAITAIDVSPVGIERARQETKEPRVRFICSTLESFDATVHDFACMFDVLEHLDDPAGALRRVNDLLGPGGRLLLSTPNRLRLANRIRAWRGRRPVMMDPTHATDFSRAELELMLGQAGFRVLRRWGVVIFVSDWLLAFSNAEGAAPSPSTITTGSAASSGGPEARSWRSTLGQWLLPHMQPLLRRVEDSRFNYRSGYFVPDLANGIYVLAEKL